MPTTRSRHALTETDEIAAILDQAANRWPGVSRARLISLVLIDWAAGGSSSTAAAEARGRLIATLPGSSVLYDRAADWPE